MTTAILAGLPGVPNIPNPITAVGNALGGAASKAAETAFEFFLRRIAQALANAAAKVVTEVLHYLDTSSTVSLDQGWFAGPRAKEITQSVLLFAAVLLVLFLLAAVIQGLVKGDVGLMVRTAAIEVPMSVFGMVVLTSVTAVLLAVTDGFSSLVLAGAPESIGRFFQFGQPDAILSLGLFGFILVPAFILGAILVWIELVVRSSLIYLLLAFSPLVLAARVWPVLAGAWHQLCRIGIALIVSKFAIALSLGLGAAALSGGGPANLGSAGPNPNDVGSQAGLTVAGLVVGASLMVLAAFAPFVVLKLLPVFEAAVVAQGISRGPLRAGQTAAQTAYYAQGLRRLAGSGGPRPGNEGGHGPGGGGPTGGPGGGAGGGTGGGSGAGVGSVASSNGAGRAVSAGAGAGGAGAGAAGSAGGAGVAAAAMVPIGVARKPAQRAKTTASEAASS